VPILIEDSKSIKITALQKGFNISYEMAKAFFDAGTLTNFDPILLASIAAVESNFDLKAVSSKGYKSLMQTKEATMKYANVDILKGSMELKYWYKRTNDIEKALVHYNGGNNPPKVSYRYAQRVISLYRQKAV